MASWPDGGTWQIEGCTREEFFQDCGTGNSENIYYESAHERTKKRLRVCKRKDRGLLISIYEEKGCGWGQICQVQVDKFETIEKAVEFMKSLCEHYAGDRIEAASLYKERDARMASAIKKSDARKSHI